MNKLFPAFAAAVLAAASLGAAAAETAQASRFDPLKTFAPYRYQYPANRYRSASGRPGPDYWQNRADYVLHANLDPKRKTLSATETITYTNRSPDPLDILWLHVEQNRYRTDARGNFSGDKAPTADQHTGGYRFDHVEVKTDKGFVPVHYVLSDTRMRIDLPQTLKPAGGRVQLRIAYSYDLPGAFGGRTDYVETKNGTIYEIAQWYPRLCVYDDLRGWDTLPYLNSEFYLEYGDFDYTVTVPSDMIVVGSGELVNPQDVLTATERARLAAARKSDATVMIVKPDEVGTPASRPKQGGTLTWHFRMKDSRDVAFGASRAYVWDAARINLPSGRTSMAMSAYPVESMAPNGWSRSTEFMKASVEHFSKKWLEYPYPNAIAEAGIAGGMEYPGIVFDWWKAPAKVLSPLTAHEIGHNWFPMVVGSNERRDAWMDEGFNTFIDVYAADAFNHGEFAPKRDSEYAPKGGNPVDEILPLLADPQAPSILTAADAVKEKYRHPVTYFKAALGLVLLREQILGPDVFDPAFRAYVHAWAYRHPSPSDFFRFMDSASGEDLSWFWRGWFAHNWQLDLAVDGVSYVDKDPAKGARVRVSNLDRLVMPATLRVTYADGSKADLRVPVETWLQHHRFDVAVPGGKRIVAATIDPDHKLPDANRANDSWRQP